MGSGSFGASAGSNGGLPLSLPPVSLSTARGSGGPKAGAALQSVPVPPPSHPIPGLLYRSSAAAAGGGGGSPLAPAGGAPRGGHGSSHSPLRVPGHGLGGAGGVMQPPSRPTHPYSPSAPGQGALGAGSGMPPPPSPAGAGGYLDGSGQCVLPAPLCGTPWASEGGCEAGLSSPLAGERWGLHLGQRAHQGCVFARMCS